MSVSIANHSNHSIDSDQALSLVEAALEQSSADAAFVSLRASEEAIARFAENQIVRNASKSRLTLTITSYFGRKSASASISALDPEAIAAAVKQSEELARIAPEDLEWVPLLQPQTYDDRHPAFDVSTARLSPAEHSQRIHEVCQACQNAGAIAAGTLSAQTSLLAIGNSTGLLACDRSTEADFSLTTRMDDGSAWAWKTSHAFDLLPVKEATQEAIERANQARSPREFEPGIYPVVLSGAAFAALLPWAIWNLDARAADEGRSFATKTDELGNTIGNRAGETLFSSLLQVQRNPAHPLLQAGRFFADGMPNLPLDIVRDGVLQTLSYSRHWAERQGKEPTGAFYPLVVAGSVGSASTQENRTLADLVSATERAILVHRAWYVRYVNPRTLEMTGTTRDGTFWIENGRIAYPIQNLRFNQSLPEMLRDIDAIGVGERLGNNIIPPVRVRDFRFESGTESV